MIGVMIGAEHFVKQTDDYFDLPVDQNNSNEENRLLAASLCMTRNDSH